MAVGVRAHLAYVSHMGGLAIVDVAEAEHPQLLRSLDPSYSFRSITFAGQYAFAAMGGFTVLDLSDPLAPQVVSHMDLSSGAVKVVVQGDYAFALDQSSLHIFDVKTPVQPRLVAVYSLRETEVARDVVVAGDYAYIAGRGLHVVNISDPAQPQRMALYEEPLPYQAERSDKAVAIDGDYAYIVTGSALEVVYIADPQAPHRVGSPLPVFHGADTITIAGHYAYLTNEFDDSTIWPMRVVDITLPDAPREVGSYSPPNKTAGPVGMVVVGDLGYVPADDDGLRIVSLANPAAPTEIGAYHLGWLNSVSVIGDYIYVNGYDYGLWVVDASNPRQLAPRGLYSLPSPSYVLDVVDQTAYVRHGNNGFSMWDVSDPGTPQEVGFQATLRPACDMQVVGQYAYLAASEAGLRILDVSAPQRPQEVAAFATLGSVCYLTVSGHYVYLVEQGQGVRIVDVADPHQPSEVGFYPQPYARSVVVRPPYAYLVTGGVETLDISVPRQVRRLAYEWTESTSAVAIVEDFLLVGSIWGNFDLFDLSDPAKPQPHLTGLQIPGGGEHRGLGSMVLHDRYAYVTQGGSLFVLTLR